MYCLVRATPAQFIDKKFAYSSQSNIISMYMKPHIQDTRVLGYWSSGQVRMANISNIS